ncbi:MAG TPA: hypothetical protein VF006_18720 [Longimicrobium sp.]
MRTSHPRRAAALAALALLAAAGCGTRDGATPAAASERTVVPVKWAMLWRAGGPEQDSVLLYPNGLLAADDAHVYVPDPAGFRVSAFRVADGSLAWTFGRRGKGPGEFTSFIAIQVNPAGEIVVADRENARLTVLGRDGALRREVSIPNVTAIESFCALENGDYFVSTGSSEPEPLVRVSATGAVRSRHAVPWTQLREAPGIQRQLHAAAAGADACVLALKLGEGFSVYRGGRFLPAVEYVEPMELPEVEISTGTLAGGARSRSERLTVRQTGPSGISVTGDTLVVPFVGRTENASRVLDLYTVASSRYVHSYLLPWRVDAVLRRGDVHFALRTYKGHPALYALRMQPQAGDPAPATAPVTARQAAR